MRTFSHPATESCDRFWSRTKGGHRDHRTERRHANARTGKALGDRELELMSEASRNAFSHLTDEEIAAIHAYLNAPPK